MNFIETLQSVELVLAAGEVPLLVGETGIGKTSLARELAHKNGWSLINIDGNLLKEGEIGGLPAISSYQKDKDGLLVEEKTTIYAVHYKLRAIDEEIAKGRTVLLFIDEINRCEHAVQQELMNLILNREINGYVLSKDVRIVAAMNPADSYDYEAVAMDAAQENRFVWLYMEADYLQWLDWAAQAGIDEAVMEFISTFPEYLDKHNEDDLNATPRSYERISELYKLYRKGGVSQSVFFNVIRGNVGKVIAEEFVHFVDSGARALINFDDVFSGSSLDASLARRVGGESHTRLYLAAKNITRRLESCINDENARQLIDRLMEFLALYPADLLIGVMKDIKAAGGSVYDYAIQNDHFIDAYFNAYGAGR